MKTFLFLDDTRERHEHFDTICQSLDVDVWHAYTALQAIIALKRQARFDCVFLDHDLEDTGDDTGQVVANFIAMHMPQEKIPRSVVIHSWNPEGAEAMRRILASANIFARVVPFSFKSY